MRQRIIEFFTDELKLAADMINRLDIVAATYADELIGKFSVELDRWILTQGLEPKDYDVYLYRLVIDGLGYAQEIRQAVLLDFLTEQLAP